MSNCGLIAGAFSSTSGKADTVLTTKGDIATYSSTRIREPVGSNGETLMVDSAQATGIKWAPSSTSVLTTAGDLLVASSANTLSRLARGSDNYILKMNGTSLNWEAESSGVALSDNNTWTGTNIFNNFISSTPTELTLSSGVVTATRMCHKIDTEGDASTDTCTHINGYGAGRLLFVQTETADRDVTYQDEQGGNGTLNMAGDFTEDGNTDVLCFISRFSDGNTWSEISRSNNGN